MSDLKSRLIETAKQWAAAHGDAPLSRVGKAVAGDANFFTRMERPETTLNLITLERFARYFGDPANWPAEDGCDPVVPDDVLDFVHVTGVSIMDAAASAGQAGDASSGLGEAA